MATETKFRAKPVNPKVKKRSDAKIALALVGSTPLTRRVQHLLSKLRMKIVHFQDGAAAIAHSDDQIVGVIVTGFSPGRALVKECEHLVFHFGPMNIAVAAVVADSTDTKVERSLYKAGVEAVFEYPSEKRELTRLIMETFSLPFSVSKKTSSDKSLKERIKKRLSAETGLIGKDLKIAVSDNIVSVAGVVDAYWKAKYLGRSIAEVSGVKGVVTSGVTLVTKSESDKRLEKNIRGLINMSSSLDVETLDISVREGEVTIKGSTGDAHELQRLEDLISQMNAVREVRLAVAVSPVQTKRDLSIAKSISKSLSSIFPKDRIDPAVFGGVVVLRGKVKTLARALEASNVVKRREGVRRVVNKLRVGVAVKA